MTTTSKPFEPSTPWPVVVTAAGPVEQSIGRFALYSLIRAHGIQWADVDGVYFELATQPVPATAQGAGQLVEAAYMRSLERRANNA